MTDLKSQARPAKGYLASWLLVIVYASFIFVVSSISEPSLNYLPQFYMSDKLLHLVEYTGFGFLLFRAFSAYLPCKKALLVSFGIASFYGFTDELHQYIVPLREADALDLLADSLGGLCGGYIGFICNKGGSLEQG